MGPNGGAATPSPVRHWRLTRKGRELYWRTVVDRPLREVHQVLLAIWVFLVVGSACGAWP